MPQSVMVKSNDVAIKASRDAEAKSIIAHFEDQLPDFRLLCFFDDADWQPFKDEFGCSEPRLLCAAHGGPLAKLAGLRAEAHLCPDGSAETCF